MIFSIWQASDSLPIENLSEEKYDPLAPESDNTTSPDRGGLVHLIQRQAEDSAAGDNSYIYQRLNRKSKDHPAYDRLVGILGFQLSYVLVSTI